MKKHILYIAGFMLLSTACQKEEQVSKVSASAIPETSELRERPTESIITTVKPGMLQAAGDGVQGQVAFGDIASSCIGIYSEDGGSTYFSMRSENGNSIAGVFAGKETGHYLKGSSMTFVSGGKTYAADDKICIHISEYGTAGGKIKGTFSGTFRRYDVDIKTGKRLEFLLQVQNGAFEVKRLADQ